MTNVEALKALYVALGNEAADVENANTIVDVLNAIAAKYEGKDDAMTNSEGIKNITAVLDNIIPEPVPSENNAKFGTNPNTFKVLSNLVSIDVPSGVTQIDASAFYGASKLSNINLPDTITIIRGNSFNNCTSLTSIEIPSSVTFIDSSTFYGCANLATITIHKAEGSITGAPWGAPSTTQIIWNG